MGLAVVYHERLVGDGFTPDRVLVDPFYRYFRSQGSQVWREYAVRVDQTTGLIDLFAIHKGWRLAIEAERTPDRVIRDIRKAKADLIFQRTFL